VANGVWGKRIMISQTQYITKEIRIEVHENGDIILVKGNQEITFDAKEIVILADSDLVMTVDMLAYNIEAIQDICESEKE